MKEVQINFESEKETVYREFTHDVTSQNGGHFVVPNQSCGS